MVTNLVTTAWVPDRVRLPFTFDADALAADVRACGETAWIRHFNREYYEGDWSGIPLRAPHGKLTIAPDPAGTAPYADTPPLARCAEVRSVLAALACATKSVRFLRLGPGARVREHSDFNIGVEYGFVRLHVGVLTGPGAEFVLNGEPLRIAPGECWFTDVSAPHRVANHDAVPRIHLVIDAVPNAALLAMLERVPATPSAGAER